MRCTGGNNGDLTSKKLDERTSRSCRFMFTQGLKQKNSSHEHQAFGLNDGHAKMDIDTKILIFPPQSTPLHNNKTITYCNSLAI